MEVVGHPKFDTALAADENPLDVRSILNQIGLPTGATLFLGGSTHGGEESILAQLTLKLRHNFPDLFLILVPRHFERANEVARELRELGIEVILRTQLPASPPDLSASPHCLIVNTTGELRHFYREADVIFIGQSFVEGGGQNPIEPAVHGRAIITGPKMETFKAILPFFLEQDALIQVRDVAELETSVRELLADPKKRADLGHRARSVVENNQGALQRTADGIVARLSTARSRPPTKVV
jgi:3-deoxy-D-manno-octulosonic-acid transferase